MCVADETDVQLPTRVSPTALWYYNLLLYGLSYPVTVYELSRI